MGLAGPRDAETRLTAHVAHGSSRDVTGLFDGANCGSADGLDGA
jgi:hypothetical protein